MQRWVRRLHDVCRGLITFVYVGPGDVANAAAALAGGAYQALDRRLDAPKTVADVIEAYKAEKEAHVRRPQLSRRELEILRLVAGGRSNREVAKILWVTDQTIKFHLENTYKNAWRIRCDAAPEVAAAWSTEAPPATIETDVYSLGATAYWLLSGRAPVTVDGIPTFAGQMLSAASQTPPRLRDVAPHVPQSIAAVVEKAMNPDLPDATARQLSSQPRWDPARCRLGGGDARTNTSPTWAAGVENLPGEAPSGYVSSKTESPPVAR